MIMSCWSNVTNKYDTNKKAYHNRHFLAPYADQLKLKRPPPLLSKHLPLFQQLVHIEKLLLVLYQCNVLDYNEVKSIQREETRDRQIMSLIDTIQHKGKAGVKRLIECIERETDHLGHAELAEELKKGNLVNDVAIHSVQCP